MLLCFVHAADNGATVIRVDKPGVSVDTMARYDSEGPVTAQIRVRDL